MPCSAHRSASAGSGSTAPVEVVPAVAATQNGTRPAARSASTAARSSATGSRKSASASITRSCSRAKPSTRSARATDACPWSDM